MIINKMPNAEFLKNTCQKCNFSPFCISQEIHSHDNQHDTLGAIQHRALHRHETLFHANHKFQHLYAIQQGTVKTYQTEADGKELIRGFYFAGDILGYEAISSGHYLYSAIALKDTIVCEIPYNKFLELLHAKPTLLNQILFLLSQQLNVGSYLVSSTAEQRLAAFLIDLTTRLHPHELHLEFILPMSRENIGNYLRLTAETISRLCTRFQKREIIAVDHKKIHILQLTELKKIAEGVSMVDVT